MNLELLPHTGSEVDISVQVSFHRGAVRQVEQHYRAAHHAILIHEGATNLEYATFDVWPDAGKVLVADGIAAAGSFRVGCIAGYH